jgi:hypothetical protein
MQDFVFLNLELFRLVTSLGGVDEMDLSLRRM